MPPDTLDPDKVYTAKVNPQHMKRRSCAADEPRSPRARFGSFLSLADPSGHATGRVPTRRSPSARRAAGTRARDPPRPRRALAGHAEPRFLAGIAREELGLPERVGSRADLATTHRPAVEGSVRAALRAQRRRGRATSLATDGGPSCVGHLAAELWSRRRGMPCSFAAQGTRRVGRVGQSPIVLSAAVPGA